MLTPSEYNGKVMELGQERRGQLIDIKYMTEDRSSIVYELPLAEGRNNNEIYLRELASLELLTPLSLPCR